MTLPHEKIWSIQRTRQFLRDLQDSQKTPKVPSSIRKEATSCLRHYPWKGDEEKFLISLIESGKMRDMIDEFMKDDKKKGYLFIEQVNEILEQFDFSDKKMDDRDEDGVPYWEKDE
jgi:hypothetical protein|tara:strand:- start:381 stop:728 length:348 start_codon:yes stop_codon:yes gene_type:complete